MIIAGNGNNNSNHVVLTEGNSVDNNGVKQFHAQNNITATNANANGQYFSRQSL